MMTTVVKFASILFSVEIHFFWYMEPTSRRGHVAGSLHMPKTMMHLEYTVQ